MGMNRNTNAMDIHQYTQHHFQEKIFNEQLEFFNNEYVRTGNFSEVFKKIDDQGLLTYYDYRKITSIRTNTFV